MIPVGDDIEARRFPIVNTALILANIAMFVWELNTGMTREMFYFVGFVPLHFSHHFSLQQAGTVFSAMFSHAGFLHIIGNLWVLFIFGDNVEDRLGHWGYLVFYLCAGWMASLVHLLANPASVLPCVGASGAIAGVLGAYLVLYPHAKVRLFNEDFSLGDLFLIFSPFETMRKAGRFFLVPLLPAWIVITVWFGLNCFGTTLHEAGSESIAWYAHIGGFLFGLAVMFFIPRISNEDERYTAEKRLALEFAEDKQRTSNDFALTGYAAAALFLVIVGMSASYAFRKPVAVPSAPVVLVPSVERQVRKQPLRHKLRTANHHATRSSSAAKTSRPVSNHSAQSVTPSL